MAPSNTQTRYRAGFTLVEMTIAVLIMGILAGVAAPRYFEAIDTFRADSAAKRIAADLNLARENANSKGGGSLGEWVSFYSMSERYKLHEDPDIDRPSEEYEIDLEETPYPAEIVSASFTNTNDYTSNTTVKFDMYGRARTGMPPFFPDAYLTSGQIVVQSGGTQRTVVINPATGEASVQ